MRKLARVSFCVLLVFLVVASLAILSGCGSGSSSTSSTNSYYGTQSPGDAWSFTINRASNTFSGTDNTTGYTYSGTFTVLPSDFLQLTITASTDSTVTLPGTAYAVEFPGTALLLKPAGTKDSVIIAAAQGSCPSPATYNWVKVANTSWIDSDPAYGIANMTGSSSSLTISGSQYPLGGTPSSPFTYSGSCSNGVINPASGSIGTFAITPSGAFIGDQGSDGGIVGMLQPSANIGTSTLLQAGRQFRGFIFMVHPPYQSNGVTPQDKTQAIWGTTTTSSNLCYTVGPPCISVGEYTDNFANGGVEDNCPNGDSCGALTFTAEQNPGEFPAVMNGTHTNNQAFTLIVNQINGKFMVFGISENTYGTPINGVSPKGPYMVVLMEQ
jgi:hypothetical protein